MAIKRAPGKRAYLAREDRHNALLDTAAQVVEKYGWPELSMISVAEHAKVSRQLIYEHFDSVDELMTQTMTHVFRDIYENVREGIKRSRGNVADLTQVAEDLTYALSPGRARALWQMITANYSNSPETARMSRRLRHLLTNMWMPIMDESFGLPDRAARVLVWMLHMAFWGAHQMVEEGEVDRETAGKLFTWITTQIQAGSVIAPIKPTKKKAS